MSGKVVGWAFEQGRKRQLSPIQRYVLIAYGDNASEAGKCWPDKPEIVEKTGLSQATVYRAIKVLEQEGLLSFETDPKGRDCALLAVPWISQSENGFSQSEKNDSQSEKRSNKGTVKEPSKNQKTVNRKTVTEDEFALAAAVVQLFNSAAGTAYTVEAHLRPIVCRIREHPAIKEHHHARIIEAVFAGEHWWKGPAGPEIIYGNGRTFERAVEAARATKKAADNTIDVNAEAERIRREQGLT